MAILDWFLHHAGVITITGNSYRLKNKATGDQPRNLILTEQEC